MFIKPSRHHKFQWHHDFAALVPDFESIHGCMSCEAEFGPITRDEEKVIVGCFHWREFLSSSERRYQHSYLIIRPHSESRTPRPGRILKLKRNLLTWQEKPFSTSTEKHPNQPTWQIQMGPSGSDFKLLRLSVYKAIKGTAEVTRNQLHLMLPEGVNELTPRSSFLHLVLMSNPSNRYKRMVK